MKMKKIGDSKKTFIVDQFVRSQDAKNWIYALIDRENLEAVELPEAIMIFYATLFDKVCECISRNCKIKIKGLIYPPDRVEYHYKYGWCIFRGEENARLGKTCLPDGAKVIIGRESYISGHSIIRGIDTIEIGEFCSVAEGFFASTSPEDHQANFLSTKTDLLNPEYRMVKWEDDQESVYRVEKESHVVIGNDVWIGRNVRCFSGVSIPSGSVVGEGSYVTKKLEKEYGIYAGIPAKLIRMRFSEATAKKIKKTNWCSWDLQKIRASGNIFQTDLNKDDSVLDLVAGGIL